MNETERKAYLEQFNRRTHVLGRIVSAITLVLLVGAGIFAYHHHEEAAKQAEKEAKAAEQKAALSLQNDAFHQKEQQTLHCRPWGWRYVAFHY